MLTFPSKLFLDSPQLSVRFNVLVRAAKYASVAKLIDSTTRKLLLLMHHIGHDVRELRLVKFLLFFFYKHCFKNANVTLQPAAHESSRPAAPGAILDTSPCGVNVFLFSIVLSFYYVLIVSNLGTLEGILDFLPKVY